MLMFGFEKNFFKFIVHHLFTKAVVPLLTGLFTVTRRYACSHSCPHA